MSTQALPVCYLNGRFQPTAEATLHVSDLSILRGYGVFDYFRVERGQPVFLSDHVRRFFRSGDHLGLKVPLCKADLIAAIRELITRNEATEGGIRLLLTGGYSENGYTPAKPNFLMLMTPPVAIPERFETEGVKVLLHRYERQLPDAKTIDYVEGIRILPKLAEAGVDYPLYLDREDNVRESDRSNYFIVTGGRLITPQDDMLRGITRLHLLKLAEKLDIPTEERAVSKTELLNADEAIICSSAKAVLPIVEVNGMDIGDGKPGTLTKRLMTEWPAYVGSTLTTPANH